MGASAIVSRTWRASADLVVSRELTLARILGTEYATVMSLTTLVTVALGVLSFGVFPAASAPPDVVLLEELTWTELRDLVRSGTTTIILPVGGTEQNGPHMALGKHNTRVRILSERIARTLGRALVGPVIAHVPEGNLSPPTGHMRFPGTITVPDEVFQRVLEASARSARAHGFRNIVILGDHGSTQSGARAVATRLNREWAKSPVRVHAIEEYYRAASVGFRQALKARGYRDDELGTHAALTDTALMLAVEPKMVRTPLMRRGTGADGGDGVDGDPTRATAELGHVGVELIVRDTVEAIRTSIGSR